MGDKRKAFESIFKKLEKRWGHLGNPNPTERGEAHKDIDRILRSAGLDWLDLLTLMSEQKASIFEMLEMLLAKDEEILIKLGLENATYFHDADGRAYADVQHHGHRRTLELVPRGAFERWLTHRFFSGKRKAPGSGALKNAIRTLTAHAEYEGDEHDVHLRVAELDGRLYIDLANADYQVVEVDAAGWRIVDDPAVRFRRTASMRPLPVPQRGGSISQLRPLLNVNDSQFVLFVAVLLDGLCSVRPHAALNPVGPEGSGKSFLTFVLRSLIDPNKSPLRALPTKRRDLFNAAHNAHALAFDNVSHIPDLISDSLCMLITGAGAGERELFTSDREFVVTGSRLIVFNGIKPALMKPDLADRTMVLLLKRIDETLRRSDVELRREFEQQRPAIFGALLDAVAHGLRRLPWVQLERAPRSIDFVRWGVACEGAYAAEGAFLAAFADAVGEATEAVIEVTPIVVAVLAFMADRGSWSGTTSQLYRLLCEHDPSEQQVTRDPAWPKGVINFWACASQQQNDARENGCAGDRGGACQEAHA